MSLWRRIIQHLLPRGRAWSAAADSMLDRFLSGLSGLPEAVREHLDRVLYDIDPDETRRLADWEEQFGLRPRSLSDSERRGRLRGRWSATGGQSRQYIQGVLRAAGFDVYVYEWFAP
ncbi:MAG: putative phage tail protein, partial [Armatimonadota bacterium]